MADLRFDAICKLFKSGGREVLAVDNLDLHIGDGEIVGLLGSSGCGKTTTLRAVAGFVELTSGTISIGDRQIQDLPPARRQVAMAFEGYALYSPLKVRENIGFALLREKRPKDQVEREVAGIAATLEIEDILDAYPAAISAGQQQRTSLARALIRKAPVTLLDEPMSQLEPRLRTLLRARVRELLAGNRQTTIFVTHDQNEAITLADRIAVMEDGKLQQYGTATELRDKPRNQFVAEFIGEPPMNIMRASSDGAGPDGGYDLVHGGASVDKLQMHGNGRNLPREVNVGIRPHRLELADEGPLRGEVVSNQWLGDQAHLLVDINGLRLVAVTAERRQGWRPGANVAVSMPERALHFFDAQSGAALRHQEGKGAG